MEITKHITKRSVLGYVFLPRIWPRLKEFFTTGFSVIAYAMAAVYGMVRLLPPTHPYLDPKNRGYFGIRHVVAAAANHLVLKKENLDQIAIFFLLLLGVILLALQFFAILYGFIVQPAAAQIFNTLQPENDIAFVLMDRVFGVPGLFCNVAGECSNIQPTLPFPFHVALQSLFQFYSLGILLIGVLVFLYYMVIVVGETAMSGTPFGQRFANIWVPIRLVFALGLLVPLNHGLNSAQYITLYAAKYGSGLATNGWTQFNVALAASTTTEFTDDRRSEIFMDGAGNPTGERESLVVRPRTPDTTPIVQFMSLAHACAYSYWNKEKSGPKPPSIAFNIKPYMVKLPNPLLTNQDEREELLLGATYESALDFYNNGDIVIRFGRYNVLDQENYKGHVEPLCGEIRIHTADVDNKRKGLTEGGPDLMQRTYFNMIGRLWFDETRLHELVQEYVNYTSADNALCKTPSDPGCNGLLPLGERKQTIITDFNDNLRVMGAEAWQKYRTVGADFNFTQEIQERGWGGAGIWYNRIARINGAFLGSVVKVPSVGQDGMPKVMRDVRTILEKQNKSLSLTDVYCPNQEQTTEINEILGNDIEIARKLCTFNNYWHHDAPNSGDSEDRLTGNAFTDTMQLIFGTQGLFDMRNENGGTHPLAQLSGLGKSLVDSAILNIAGSTGLAFGGGMIQALSYQKTGAGLSMAGSALSTIAFLGLTAGFILFYILPFMPFLYFFFAVGTWVKTIFEAMVGVPLWALAHLRLDGDGLPGESAINGYYLIFEIFLRPIIIVFGLIAAMIIFTAQVRILHFIWDVVLNNLTGYEPDPTIGSSILPIDRGIIDEFFYTIIYAMVVYMMANASFKMIDRIPQSIMRWMGSSATSFGDQSQDNIEQLNRYAAIAGASTGQQVSGAITQASGQLGRSAGGALNRLSNLGRGGPAVPPGGA